MKQLHLTTLCVHFCTLQIFIAHLDFCIQNTQAALSKAPTVQLSSHLHLQVLKLAVSTAVCTTLPREVMQSRRKQGRSSGKESRRNLRKKDVNIHFRTEN